MRPYDDPAYRRIRTETIRRGGICWLCGSVGADSVDHVRPVASFPRGTPLSEINDPRNLRPAHRGCNYRRRKPSRGRRRKRIEQNL